MTAVLPVSERGSGWPYPHCSTGRRRRAETAGQRQALQGQIAARAVHLDQAELGRVGLRAMVASGPYRDRCVMTGRPLEARMPPIIGLGLVLVLLTAVTVYVQPGAKLMEPPPALLAAVMAATNRQPRPSDRRRARRLSSVWRKGERRGD